MRRLALCLVAGWLTPAAASEQDRTFSEVLSFLLTNQAVQTGIPRGTPTRTSPESPCETHARVPSRRESPT